MRVGVVGGGIIGWSVAYELARRGADVVIFAPPASGAATAASAGILAPYVEGHSEPLLQLGVRALNLYDQFVARITEAAGRSVEYERCGSLHVARDERESADLEAIRRRLGGRCVPHQQMDDVAVRESEPALATVWSALRIAAHGYVNVDALMDAVRVAASRYRTLTASAAVERVDEVGGRPVLSGSNGQEAVDAVVIAAGSWSGQLAIGATPTVPVRPIRGQRLLLRGTPGTIAQIVWGARCYLVPWRDGRVVVGATVEDTGFDVQPAEPATRELFAAAAGLVPALGAATLEHVRVGLRPLIAGELPVIGRSSTMRNVFYATGHYRSGILLAPLTATLVADQVLEGREDPDLTFVAPSRYGL